MRVKLKTGLAREECYVASWLFLSAYYLFVYVVDSGRPNPRVWLGEPHPEPSPRAPSRCAAHGHPPSSQPRAACPGVVCGCFRLTDTL